VCTMCVYVHIVDTNFGISICHHSLTLNFLIHLSIFMVFIFYFIYQQVGVQTEIEPDAGANALEDRVNAVMPLANKEDEDEEAN
jgi:hypothetical protein